MKDFMTLAHERYSVRAFKPDPVENEKLDKLTEVACCVPTACNNQPQKVYVVRAPENIAKLSTICPCIYGAPVVFVFGSDVTRAAKGKICDGFDFGQMDASITCTHVMLEAAELGLGSCWVGWFNSDDVKAALALPENVQVWALLPIGYAADGASPSQMHTASRATEDMVAYL